MRQILSNSVSDMVLTAFYVELRPLNIIEICYPAGGDGTFYLNRQQSAFSSGTASQKPVERVPTLT
jgi:hypothetical protein